MRLETKISLLEITNEISQVNNKYLSKLSEIVKSNGSEGLTEEQEKLLADASMRLVQAGAKIYESCK